MSSNLQTVRLVSTLGPWPCHDLVLTTSCGRQVYTYKDLICSHSEILEKIINSNPHCPEFKFDQLSHSAIKIAVHFLSGVPIDITIADIPSLMNLYRAWKIKAVLDAVENSIGSNPLIAMANKFILSERFELKDLKKELHADLHNCAACCIDIKKNTLYPRLPIILQERIELEGAYHARNYYMGKNWKTEKRCRRCDAPNHGMDVLIFLFRLDRM